MGDVPAEDLGLLPGGGVFPQTVRRGADESLVDRKASKPNDSETSDVYRDVDNLACLITECSKCVASISRACTDIPPRRLPMSKHFDVTSFAVLLRFKTSSKAFGLTFCLLRYKDFVEFCLQAYKTHDVVISCSKYRQTKI